MNLAHYTHTDSVDLPVLGFLRVSVAHRLDDPSYLLLHRLVVLAAATRGAAVLLVVDGHESEHQFETRLLKVHVEAISAEHEHNAGRAQRQGLSNKTTW